MDLRWKGLATAGPVLFVAAAAAAVAGGCTGSQQRSTGCGKVVAYSLRDGEPYFVSSAGLDTVVNCFLHANDTGRSADLQFHYQGIDTSIDARFSTSSHRVRVRSTFAGNGRTTERSVQCPHVDQQTQSVTFSCTQGVTLTFELAAIASAAGRAAAHLIPDADSVAKADSAAQPDDRTFERVTVEIWDTCLWRAVGMVPNG